MHLRQPFLLDQPKDFRLRVVLGPPDDAHLRAERHDGVDLIGRHELRHADDRPRSPCVRGIGERPAVIAG